MAFTIDGTTGISGVDGSVSTPSLKGSNTGTGVYFPVANTLGIVTGGVERLRVDSSGNVGIGNTSPAQKLHVYNSTTPCRIRVDDANTAVDMFSSSGGGYVGTVTNHILGLVTNGSERMRIDTSGNIGIGTTSPGAKLDVYGLSSIVSASNNVRVNTRFKADATVSNMATLFDTNATAGTTSIRGFYHGYQSQIFSIARFDSAFNAGVTNDLYIDSSGQVGIGLTPTTRNNTRLQIVDGIGFPATQVASSDANTLDDYEEGSWTPALKFGGNSVGLVSTVYGRYTKVGNVVTVIGYIAVTNKGSSTGIAQISGLPFTSYNYGNAFYGSSIYIQNGQLVPAAGNLPQLALYNTQLDVNYVTQAGGVDGNYTQASWGTAGAIWFSATYLTNT